MRWPPELPQIRIIREGEGVFCARCHSGRHAHRTGERDHPFEGPPTLIERVVALIRSGGRMKPVVSLDLAPIDYADLDAGIRDTVRLLRAHGFETTDSGDGVSKLLPDSKYYGCNPEPQAHVYCATTDDQVVAEARRLADLLGDEWTVEGVFMASSGTSMLSAIKMSQSQMAAAFYASEAAH